MPLFKNLAAKIEMNSDNRQRGQTALYEVDTDTSKSIGVAYSQIYNGMKQENLNNCHEFTNASKASEILKLICSEEVLIVNSRRRNGLILYKGYHAEFAGPGAAVGGWFDIDCQQVLPVGDLSLVKPESSDERQRAYLIRRQWVRLMKQITDNPSPMQRSQMVLNQFENYFDAKTIAQMPDDAFALLVGVLPQTISKARHTKQD